MKTCAICIHYHDLGDKLMCDKGIMECLIIGGAKVRIQDVQVDGCSEFGEARPILDIQKITAKTTELIHAKNSIDRRTKAYKDAHK